MPAVSPPRPLLGGRARCGHDAKLLEQAGHVRSAPMLGLLAVLHPEEVDPVGLGLLAVAGMPTDSPSWVPE
jgi:hypothetical protein